MTESIDWGGDTPVRGTAAVPAATVRRFRRRPVEVQAVQVAGSHDGQAARDIARWCGGTVTGTRDDPVVLVGVPTVVARARVGDWIVREPAAVGHTHRVIWDPTMHTDHEEIAP